MLHIISSNATLTDGTESALTIQSGDSFTVQDRGVTPYLVSVGVQGNYLTYARIKNNSPAFLTNDLDIPCGGKLADDGFVNVRIPPIPLLKSSVFSVTGLATAA